MSQLPRLKAGSGNAGARSNLTSNPSPCTPCVVARPRLLFATNPSKYEVKPPEELFEGLEVEKGLEVKVTRGADVLGVRVRLWRPLRPVKKRIVGLDMDGLLSRFHGFTLGLFWSCFCFDKLREMR